MTKVILKNIYKKYTNGEEAAKNINFTVEDSEFLVLVGPSGCGKSTILRMIAGLEDITSGELYFDDIKINNNPPKMRDVGMVFQNYALYPHLTIFENLAFPLSIKKESKKFINEEVKRIAELLELSEYLNKKPKELSGGQRQRVALGRAIIKKPKVFLFDEPLSNLDAKLRVQMRTEIINLHKKIGTTSVYVTHDQVEAMTMGDKLVVIKSGVIQQIAKPYNLYNSPANMFVAGFIGSPKINFFKGNLIIGDNILFIEENNGLKIPVPRSIFKNSLPKDNSSVFLGIRPENIFIDCVNNDDYFSFNSKINNIEYIGHETLLYFETASGQKCCRVNKYLGSNGMNGMQFYVKATDFNIFNNEGIII
jgi:multiple sugar transport system ATP-binding protein